MPKGILEFNLTEEQNEFEIAVKSMDWALFAWDFFHEFIRPQLKYDSQGLDEKTLEVVKDVFFEKLESHGLSLDMIH